MSYRKKHVEVGVKTKLGDRSKTMWEVGQGLESGGKQLGRWRRKKKIWGKEEIFMLARARKKALISSKE